MEVERDNRSRQTALPGSLQDGVTVHYVDYYHMWCETWSVYPA